MLPREMSLTTQQHQLDTSRDVDGACAGSGAIARQHNKGKISTACGRCKRTGCGVALHSKGTTMAIRLRLQHPGGRTALSVPDPSTTMSQFRVLVAAETRIEPGQQRLLAGYPPAEVDAPPDAAISTTQLGKGGTVIVEKLPPPPPSTTISKGARVTQSAPPESIAARKVVAADNSCLFNSVGYLLENHSLELSTKLRELIASAVLADQETYNAAVLGDREPSAYADWITDHEHWGGSVELAVLSKHYETEIVAIDIKTGNLLRFGEGQGYSQMCFLAYDGIHYDPLVLKLVPDAPEEHDLTVFPVGDDATERKMAEFGAQLKQQRQFTDVASFSLRCLACQTGLVGQAEAREHAMNTGHTNFGEY
eukprot:m.448516 g.448516  ORF g.448516 m.448516 type:complete len:366 (-) comp20315_c14_seq41:4755-5852(-)